MRLTPEQHDTPAAAIGFCDTSSPCVGVQHPSFPALLYMDIRADEPSGHTSFFSGYVTQEVLALVKAAPDLLALARQYASECAECNGTGLISRSFGGDGFGDRCAALADADDQPCPECEDIRAVLALATGGAR